MHNQQQTKFSFLSNFPMYRQSIYNCY